MSTPQPVDFRITNGTFTVPDFVNDTKQETVPHAAKYIYLQKPWETPLLRNPGSVLRDQHKRAMVDSSAPSASNGHAMAPPRHSRWSDLNSELLVSIAATDGVTLRDYTSLCGVCTAWRSALAPLLYPCLLSVAQGHDNYIASVFSIPMRRSFHLHTGSSVVVEPQQSFYCRARAVGSGNGCFAIAMDEERTVNLVNMAAFASYSTRRIFLVESRARKTVQLVSPPGDNQSVCKIVFVQNPNPNPPGHNDGWTAVALYGCNNRVA